LLLAFRYESSADSRHGTSSLYNDRGTKLRTIVQIDDVIVGQTNTA